MLKIGDRIRTTSLSTLEEEAKRVNPAVPVGSEAVIIGEVDGDPLVLFDAPDLEARGPVILEHKHLHGSPEFEVIGGGTK